MSPSAQTRHVVAAEDAAARSTASFFGHPADARFANAYCRSIDPLILFVVFLARIYFSLRHSLVGGLSDFFVVGVAQIY
jgi:hypothetical protein